LIIKGGKAVEIKINVSRTTTTRLSKNHSNSTVEMVASGTFSPGGDLGNSTGIFSQASLPMPDTHDIKQVSFIFTPSTKLKPGDYMMMLGAQNQEVAMLKAVKVHVIS